MSKVVKMSLHISEPINDKLEKIAEETHTTKSDVLRKAIFLMDVAMDSKKHGNKVAVVDSNDRKVGDIVGYD